MLINYREKNIKLTDADRAYFEKKFKSLEKLISFFGEEPNVFVSVDLEKGKTFIVDITIELPKLTIRTTQKTHNLFEAFDKAKDDLKQELRKKKEKTLSSH